MYIIGISAFYHDSSVCLFRDNQLIFACEEEKFTGIKHDDSFPKMALDYIYNHYKITNKNLQAVCYYEDPKLLILDYNQEILSNASHDKNSLIKYDNTDIFSSTINKLFENTVKISPKDYLVIPCLLAIANPAFNIVEFETENTNVKIYALIKLDIKCQFNYDKFLKDWSITKSVIFLKNNYDKSNKLNRSRKKKLSKKKQSKKKSYK